MLIIIYLFISLDFLRDSKELSDWFGRSFSFLGNPLMLPFTMSEGLQLAGGGVRDRVEAHVSTQPHKRMVQPMTHWQYEDFLCRWKNDFEALCSAKR